MLLQWQILAKVYLLLGCLYDFLSTIFLLIDATDAVLEALVMLLLANFMPKVYGSSPQQGQLKRFGIWRTWVS